MITDWDEFKVWCGCGSRLKVLIFNTADNNDITEYNCPECGKEFTAISAIKPKVKLINRRNNAGSEFEASTPDL